MDTLIPFDCWEPLPVSEVTKAFAGAPFRWGLAGGYAIEQFLGSSIRQHGDIDVIVCRDEQLQVQRWLDGWKLYAADPPGTLRVWSRDEFLPVGIHDIWGHRFASQAWQLQLMLAEVEGDEWVSRHHSLIRGQRDDLILEYNGIPCIRIEIQLMYKSRHRRPKDEVDFHASLPMMSGEAKGWLRDQLRLLHPQGHDWLNLLNEPSSSSF